MPERKERGIACRYPSGLSITVRMHMCAVPVMADVDMDRSVVSHLLLMTKKAE
jgi:hypothetical protein